MDSIFIKYLDLPTDIRGLTKQNSDGSYTIIINSRLTREINIQTYRHELEHITGDDFLSDAPVSTIEDERHD